MRYWFSLEIKHEHVEWPKLCLSDLSRQFQAAESQDFRALDNLLQRADNAQELGVEAHCGTPCLYSRIFFLQNLQDFFFFGRNPFVWSDLGLSFFWRWMNWTWTTTGDWRTNIRQLFVTGASIEEAPHFNALSEWSEMNGLWNAGGLRKNQDLGKIKKGPWLQERSTQGSRFPCVCHWSSFRSLIVGRKPISGCCRTGENRTHSFVCALMSFFLNLLKKFEYVWTCYGFGLLSTLPHISFRFDALVLLLRCHIFLRVFARRSEIPWSWLCHLQRMICKGTVWALIGLSLGLLLLRLFNPFFVDPFASWVLKKNNQKRRI